MSLLVISPILIPLITAAISVIVLSSKPLRRFVNVIGALAHLLASIFLLKAVLGNGIQVAFVGSWAAPFGITIVADLLSAIMIVLTGIIGFAVSIYSLGDIDEERERHGYFPLYHTLLMGVSGAFLTGDLFNMYVWFEVMLMSSFALMALGSEKRQLEGGIKYVILSLVSSLLFLCALGIIYGSTGTLNIADLATKVGSTMSPPFALALSMLLLLAFGIKAALFPMFFWLPSSYHTPPVAVSAILAGLLTKVGVYALIRVFTIIFFVEALGHQKIILVLAGFTMVTGVLGAAADWEFRRLLSFHIISQIGYMIMGLGLYTVVGLAGTIFYIVHHIIVKSNLFLVSGITNRLQGSFFLKKIGGFYKTNPLLCIGFLIPAFSLAGLPPLSGFYGKFILIKDALEYQRYGIAITAVLVGLLTLYSMTKIWAEAFWTPAPDGQENKKLSSKEKFTYFAPVLALAGVTILISFNAKTVYDVSYRAAEELMNPRTYVQAVLQPGS